MYKINANSSVPLFEQIEQKTKLCIASGAFPEGKRIPSIRDIAKVAAINHQTVVKAYRNLVGEGITAPVRGMGVVVTKGAKTKCQRYQCNYLKRQLEETLAAGALGGLSFEEMKSIVDAAVDKANAKFKIVDIKEEQEEWAQFRQDRRRMILHR